MQPESVRHTLTSNIEPILKDTSLSGTWFRVCFMSKASFWLRGVDEEWAYPLLIDMLSPTNPDYEGCWAGVLHDNGHIIINDVRFRSILYQNFERLLTYPDLQGEPFGNKDDLILRTIWALFRETDDTNKSFVEDFAQRGEPALLERFSEIIYRELSKVDARHIWQAWLNTYLRLRCDSPTRDEAFYLLGIIMYSPNESAALELIDLLDLCGESDFNSSDAAIYSLLKNLHEGVANGRNSTGVKSEALSRLKKIAPP